MTEDQNLSEAEAHELLQKALTQYAGVLKKMGAGHMPTASEVGPAMDMIRGELERLRAAVVEEKDAKNTAYTERNQLVAALSKLFPASVEPHQPKEGEIWDPKWSNVVIIDLPTGQASWHIHEDEIPLFQHLQRATGRKWDGHTTEEKYRRVAALSKLEYLVGGFANGPDGMVMSRPDGMVMTSLDGVTWTKWRKPSEPQDTKPKPHSCWAKSAKNGGFGMAIESCEEDNEGHMIVGNDEYSNPVDFCPFCGAKARTPVPPSMKEPR